MSRGKPNPKVLFQQQKAGRVLVSIAAKHCGVNRATPWRWAKKKEVRSTVVGGYLFVRLDDCERMAGVR
jgi:hypothetical protein